MGLAVENIIEDALGDATILDEEEVLAWIVKVQQSLKPTKKIKGTS